jgi:hypothetical protein
MLIEIAAIIGLRSVLHERVADVLGKHDTIRDLSEDLHFIIDEISDDLQHALHGSDLGKQCQTHEMQHAASLSALRKENQ